MSNVDSLPIFGPGDIASVPLGPGEVSAMLPGWPARATEVPVYENMGKRQVGVALLCRVRRLDGETDINARIVVTDEGVLRHMRAQGTAPGTVTEMMRDGVIYALSLNTGKYRQALTEWAQ